MASARVVLFLALFSQLSLMVTWGRNLATEEIAFTTRSLLSGLHEIEATDGSAALVAVVSPEDGFLSCQISTSEALVEDIINDPAAVFREIGKHEIQDMWQRCAVAEARSEQPESSPLDIRQPARGRRLSRREGTTFKPDLNTGDAQGPNSTLFIVPGTLWCGKGNIANTSDDLGVHRETDRCCRTHDRCPYYIPALTRKYNYLNLKPWTLSYCDCDNQLYHCLKSVNNTASDTVGRFFFGLLEVQCFNFAEGEYCSEYHWTHLWCNKHANGTIAVVQDFPYTWYGKPGGAIGK